MLSRNHRSWSAASSGEKLSRSSTGNSRNGSPKILLTASLESFERSVTVRFLCDEDHIRPKIAVHVPVTGGTAPQFARAAQPLTATPYQRRGSGTAASAIWLDLQAG